MGGLTGAQHVPTTVATAPSDGTAAILQEYSTDQAATGLVLTTAFDDLMLITAGLSAVGVGLALWLRNTASGSGEKVVVEARPRCSGPATCAPPRPMGRAVERGIVVVL